MAGWRDFSGKIQRFSSHYSEMNPTLFGMPKLCRKGLPQRLSVVGMAIQQMNIKRFITNMGLTSTGFILAGLCVLRVI